MKDIGMLLNINPVIKAIVKKTLEFTGNNKTPDETKAFTEDLINDREVINSLSQMVRLPVKNVLENNFDFQNPLEDVDKDELKSLAVEDIPYYDSERIVGEIQDCDEILVMLFKERLKLCKLLKESEKKAGMPANNASNIVFNIQKKINDESEEYKKYVEMFFNKVYKLSSCYKDGVKDLKK